LEEPKLTELEEACRAWEEAKQNEKTAAENRRDIEEWIAAQVNIPESFEGTKTVAVDNFKIKVTGRMTRKVDELKLQRIAEIHGTTDQLSTLFRWKADINKAVWDTSDPEITAPLLAAITTKPGRPGFQISREQEK
jgi:inorganic triphosphatase YgiF